MPVDANSVIGVNSCPMRETLHPGDLRAVAGGVVLRASGPVSVAPAAVTATSWEQSGPGVEQAAAPPAGYTLTGSSVVATARGTIAVSYDKT